MFVDIAGERVFVEVSGAGPDVVVGVSGSFGTSEIWHPPFRSLSGSCRTVAYDHFGTGLTDVPAESVTFEHQVELLGGVLDEFSPDRRCVLAGDSSMTAVVIEATFRWPHQVSGLVLVSGGLDFAPTDPVIQFVAGLRTAFDLTIDSFVKIAMPEDTIGDYQRWLKAIITRTGGERAALLVESFYPVTVRHRFPGITVPTIVIHGELDHLPTSPLSASQEMADTIRKAQLVVLPGTGHVPTITRPEPVAAAITELLNTRT